MVTLDNYKADWQTIKAVKGFNMRISNGEYPNLDFSQSTYVNKETPIKVRCVSHNQTFIATLKDIRQGRRTGCRQCSNEARVKRMQSEYTERCLSDSSWEPAEPWIDSVTPIKHKCLCCGDIKTFQPVGIKVKTFPQCARVKEDIESERWLTNWVRKDELTIVDKKALRKALRKRSKKDFDKWLKKNTSVKRVSKFKGLVSKCEFYCEDCNNTFERRCGDIKDRVTRKGLHACPRCASVNYDKFSLSVGLTSKELASKYSVGVIGNITDEKGFYFFSFPCGHSIKLRYRNLRDTYNFECPICREKETRLRNFAKPHKLYYIEIHGRYKIGVTHQENIVGKDGRYCLSQDIASIRIVHVWENLSRADAYEKERNIIRQFEASLYTGDKLFADYTGNTEVFSYDVLGLDYDN